MSQPAIHAVVMGASAGGIEAIEKAVADLPPDFAAPVFVVVHVASGSLSVLPRILERAGSLPAGHARDGERWAPGRIYVAPPGYHLLVVDGRLALGGGPKENGHRPAVDPLFRSAARTFGPRLAGVVLSGMLDDGAAGVAAVQAAGGVVVIQDPEDAAFPGMPRHALDKVAADHLAPAVAIGGILASLAGGASREETGHIISDREHESAPEPAAVGFFSCPDCNGVLQPADGEVFRCRVGHTWAPQSLLAKKSDELEEALWVALRTLEERAELSRSLAARAHGRNHVLSAQRFEQQVARSEELAQTLRAALDWEAAPAVAEPDGNQQAEG